MSSASGNESWPEIRATTPARVSLSSEGPRCRAGALSQRRPPCWGAEPQRAPGPGCWRAHEEGAQ
eukprot:4980482-Alexandrium_andersonii.AAC.1